MTRVGLLAPGSDGTAQGRSRSSATRERIRKRARPPDRAAVGAAHVRGRSRRARQAHVDAGAARSSTRSTPRSTRRSRTSSRRASGCCSRSTCRARWRAARSPACRASRPRDASAALALVTAATETRYEVVGFYAASGGFRKRGRGRCAAATRRPDAARDLAAAAAGRRRASGDATCRSAAPTARCRCCTRGRGAGGRHVRDLHRQRDLGGRHPPGPGARATTAARRASTPSWWWSAWSRTASRSPTRTTRACSTSSASTPRRRS